MPKNLIIHKHFLILCEGIDAFNFLCNYLNSSALEDDPRYSNDIQIFDFGGITELSLYLSNLQKMDHYIEVNRILIFRDAETDVQAAIQSIKQSLANNSLPVPETCNQWCVSDDESIKVAYTLLPSCSNHPIPGALEDLCWDIINNNNADNMKNDVHNFLADIIQKYNSIGSHEHKSQIHTYLSINKNYISMKIGEAAKAGAFNWNHDKLNDLRKLLSDGF